MHVLITGAGGYFGSVAGSTLLNSSKVSDLTVMVRDRHRWLQQPPPWWPAEGLRIVEAEEFLAGRWTCRGVDGVVHLAALSRDSMQPAELAENIAFGHALVAQAKHVGVSQFLNASSQAVYGVSPLPWTEQQPAAPITMHGMSKLALELALHHSGSHALESTSLRLAKLVGPSPRFRISPSEWPHVLVHAALHRRSLRVHQSDSQMLDLLDVRDAARCVELLLRKSKGSWPKMMNVGSGTSVTLRCLVDLVSNQARQRLGWPLRVEFLPKPGEKLRHFGMAIELAEQSIGWRPRTSLTNSISDLFDLMQA